MDRRTNKFLMISILIFFTFIFYSNVLFNSFSWDDQIFIVNNPFIRNLKYLPDFFQKRLGETSSWGSGFDCYYRPLFLVSFALDYHLWGLKPFFFHLHNVLLHVICAILVFYFAKQFLRNDIFAFFSSLFFGLHPVHTEAVTAVHNRMDILVSCFVLGSFLCFCRFLKAQTVRLNFYLYTLVFFCLALFSKEFAIMLPLAFFLYDLLFIERNIFVLIRQRWLHYLGFGAVLLFYLSFRFLALGYFTAGYGHQPSDIHFAGINPTLLNFYVVFQALFVYVKKLLLPLSLNVVNQYVPSPWGGFGVIFSLVLTMASFYFVVVLRNKRKEISFWILWFFIMIFPVSQIIPFGNIVAERYTYLPSVGFCCLLGYLFVLFYDNVSTWNVWWLNKRVVVLMVAGISIFYAYRTILRNYDWRTELTLWESSVKQDPFYAGTRIQLANAYFDLGRYADAEREYKKALTMEPLSATAMSSLGALYVRQGKTQEGLKLMLIGLQNDPNHSLLYRNVGSTYHLMKEYDKAIHYLRIAKSLNKGLLELYYDLGLAYANKGDYEKAAREFKEAIAIDRNFAYSYYGLGLVNFKQGKEAEAQAFFQKAIQLDPNFRFALKKLYEEKNREDTQE